MFERLLGVLKSSSQTIRYDEYCNCRSALEVQALPVETTKYRSIKCGYEIFYEAFYVETAVDFMTRHLGSKMSVICCLGVLVSCTQVSKTQNGTQNCLPEAGKAVPHLRVIEWIYNDGWKVFSRTTVNSDGSFTFELLENGPAIAVSGRLTEKLMVSLESDRLAGQFTIGNDQLPTFELYADNWRAKIPGSIIQLRRETGSAVRKKYGE